MYANRYKVSGSSCQNILLRNTVCIQPAAQKLTDAGIELPEFPEHSVQVKYATEHRCGVVIKGPNLTDNISGTDPLKDNLPLRKCTSTDTTAEVSTFDITRSGCLAVCLSVCQV